MVGAALFAGVFTVAGIEPSGAVTEPSGLSITPGTVVAGGTFTLNGTDLADVTTVTVAGVPVAIVTPPDPSPNDTSMVLQTFNYTVTGLVEAYASWQAVPAGTLTVTPAPGPTPTAEPTIDDPGGLTPATVAAGGTFVLNGTNLSGVTMVTVGGSPVTILNAPPRTNTSMTLQTVSYTTTGPVRAFAGWLSSDNVPPVVLTVTAPTGPVVTSLTPGATAGTPVIAGDTFTITGTDLGLVTGVSIDGTPLGIVTPAAAPPNDTSMVLQTYSYSASGTLRLIAGWASTDSLYVYVAPPGAVPSPTAPSIDWTSMAPNPVIAGQTFTLMGTNLDKVTSVSIAGTPIGIDSVTLNNTRLTLRTYSYTTSGDVEAFNGWQSVSSPPVSPTDNDLVVNQPVTAGPTVTSISPASGVGGSVFSITGTGLTGASSVQVGGTPVTINFVDDTGILVTTNAWTPTGVVEVRVGWVNAVPTPPNVALPTWTRTP